LSSGTQKTRAELLAALVREMRQTNGLGASFFRAAAGRVGMTVTDLQVIDILDSTGPMTAGQLADLTGLTTGAITGMLNRLEEAEIVRRERDPDDGRRVIVRLVPGKESISELSLIFAALEEAWTEVTAAFDDAQIVFLLKFLQESNTQTQRELFQVRTTPGDAGNALSAPVGDVASGRLVVAGFAKLILRTEKSMTDLYQARFEGPTPDVKLVDGVVSIRYPRRLWSMGGKQRTANIALNATIPWQIVIQGGAAEITAELGRANLAGLEMGGGANVIHIELPMPGGVVPIRISGGASSITVQRPVGAAARVHLKAWVSTFVFDDKRFSDLGNDVRLQSPDYDVNAPYYDIEVASSASMITITSD
jgi:DNA-binding MarR family transcriptional regulator